MLFGVLPYGVSKSVQYVFTKRRQGVLTRIVEEFSAPPRFRGSSARDGSSTAEQPCAAGTGNNLVGHDHSELLSVGRARKTRACHFGGFCRSFPSLGRTLEGVWLMLTGWSFHHECVGVATDASHQVLGNTEYLSLDHCYCRVMIGVDCRCSKPNGAVAYSDIFSNARSTE